MDVLVEHVAGPGCATDTGPISGRMRSVVAARSVRERLSDIVISIEKIDRFLAGQSFQCFSLDALIRDAVVRNLEILSEASRHTPNDPRAKASHIAWREIADFGFAMGYDPARLAGH